MSVSVIKELDRILTGAQDDSMFLFMQTKDDLLDKALDMGKAYKLFTVHADNLVFDERGYEVVRAGGFSQWLANSQGLSLGNQESSQNSIWRVTNSTANIAHTQEKKISSLKSIGQKIYKWTDHKTISILVGTALGAWVRHIWKWFCQLVGW